jgi:4-alpha-glucanotransferase
MVLAAMDLSRERTCGILLHPTSLPGRYGIGTLGQEAFRFADFLRSAGQCLWQVLPLGPTGYGDSPYQSFSAFAGNPLLIDLVLLAAEGLLDPKELADAPQFPEHQVDYEAVDSHKTRVLGSAFLRWRRVAGAEERARFEAFCAREQAWLPDFALFMALKAHFEEQGLPHWNRWPRELARREPQALQRWENTLAEEVKEQRFRQYLFFNQWEALRAYAAQRGIRFIGDIPIFVSYNSADVWAHQELFRLTPEGDPEVVAGVPPDYFSATGQLWGNPIYRWERLRAEGYRWWLDRVRCTLRLVDLARLDHFRGFQASWQVPAGDPTAERGRWVRGPGAEFLRALKRELGDLPIIAEDLGVITRPVERLRDRFGLPGMKVLQFAFDGKSSNPFLPHNYSSRCVVYTGTHDNDTTQGWYRRESEEVRDQVRRYLARDGHDICWDLVRLAYASVAGMAVAPLQDLMKLGSEARMNFPSRAEGNWRWRFTRPMLTEEIRGRLLELALLYGRTEAAEEVPAGQPSPIGQPGAMERPGATEPRDGWTRDGVSEYITAGLIKPRR